MVQPNSGGTNGTTPFNQDLINEIFGQQPELSFLGHLSQSGLGQNQQKALRGQLPEFLARLRQSAGQQLVQGNIPTLLNDDFFKDLNFRDELFRLSPDQRGQSRGQFGAGTRFGF